jgi:hypothetical protein
MRDFGFWVRIVAITQLFSLVLLNYGEGWLAPDNPVLTLAAKTAVVEAPSEPEVQIPSEAKAEARITKSSKVRAEDDETGPGNAVEQYGAGWGGFEAPEMEQVAPDQPEYVRNGSLEADTSMWAGEGE